MSFNKTLQQKGWNEKDIAHAEKIIEKSHEYDKSETKPFANRVVYWIVLIVAIIGNLLISIVLIPFLLVLQPLQLYVIMGTIALAFGFLFNLLITDIEHLDIKHHIIAGVFIPGFALINVFVMVNVSNVVEKKLLINNTPQNPWVTSIVYVAAFILPFLYNKLTER